MVWSVSALLAGDASPGALSGRCGVCGLETDAGFDCDDILDATAANITVLFPHFTGLMCAACRAAWAESKRFNRGIIATPDRVLFPLIAAATPVSAEDAWREYHRLAGTSDASRWTIPFAKKIAGRGGRGGERLDHPSFVARYEALTARDNAERPLWREALPALDLDQSRVVVLTTDPKKRVWPLARVSRGADASLYLHDPARGVSGNRTIRIPALRDLLALVEHALALGCAKAQLWSSLLTSATTVERMGHRAVITLERELAAARRQPEFLPALIIAQRQEAA